MKRISAVISFGFIGLLFLSMSASVYAQSLCPKGQFARLCNLQLSNSSGVVGNIITVLLIFAVIVALIFLIVGGIRWIMSSGDKAKLDSARGTVTAAIVGLILAFSAYFILNIIVYLFTGSAILKFKIPTIVP